MKTEEQILERMKLIEEAIITATKLQAPTKSYELMLDILDWVLKEKKKQ